MGIIVATSSMQNLQNLTFISGQVMVKQPDSVETKTTETDENQMDSSQAAYMTTAENSHEFVSISISREGLKKLDEQRNASSSDINLEDPPQSGWDLSRTAKYCGVENELRLSWNDLNKEDYDKPDQNLLKAYSEIYNEIKTGYANGSREIYISDGNGGCRLATEEEEISMLDKELENCAKSYEDSCKAKEYLAKIAPQVEHSREEWQRACEERHGLRADRRSDEEWERYASLKQEKFEKYKKGNYIENFAERVSQMQSFVKSMYSQYSNDLIGLVGVAYQSLEIENRDELQ